jgi:hypothetical protein
MTWFSLPETQADNKAAFFDSDSAAVWLEGQPQANALVMLDGFVAQIEAFNGYCAAPRVRFKTLEVLRKAIFAVSGECQKRFENKPLPLLPAEQGVADTTRRLWRACAVGYLHCLRACLARDSSIVRHSAEVAHRVLACLRMEQRNGYLAGAELEGEFWHTLHSVLASAEQLGVTREPVEDRLLGETSESTVNGQYCMVLLLHLACPFALSRGQFAAASHWFARWREQATVLDKPDESPKSCCIALDLSQDKPIHDNLHAARFGRWLSVTKVLRKIYQRLERLAKGESPESLKLGSGLSTEACVALLNVLSDQLKYPRQGASEAFGQIPSITVAAGLENIHRLLGGKGLKESAAAVSPYGSYLSGEQIAVFGHVVRNTDGVEENKTETWRMAKQGPGELQLLRPAGSGEARLVLKGLLAVQLPQHEHCSLATINCLSSRNDGNLVVIASLFSGNPVPLLAEIREKTTGKTSRHPAFMLPEEEGGSPPSVFLPAGLPPRALSIRFHEALEQSPLRLRLLDLLERGGDNERWSFASDQ